MVMPTAAGADAPRGSVSGKTAPSSGPVSVPTPGRVRRPPRPRHQTERSFDHRPVRSGRRIEVGRAAAGRFGVRRDEGVVGQRRRTTGRDRVLGDGHADLARDAGTGAKDLEQSGSGHDAKDESEGHEGEFGGGHAIGIGRVSNPLGWTSAPAQRQLRAIRASNPDKHGRNSATGAWRGIAASGARPFAGAETRMVDSGQRQPAGFSLRLELPRPGKGTTPLGHRAAPGIPRPARRRLLAPVQHRVPGSVPGRHELPRLPEPRRRRAVRGGLHPVARARTRSRRCAPTSARRPASAPAAAATSTGRWPSGP